MKRIRFSILTLLMLLTSVFFWLVYLSRRPQVSELRERIHYVKMLVREAHPVEPRKIYICENDVNTTGLRERAWNIHLPKVSVGEYRLRLAVDGIEETGSAKPIVDERMESGNHDIKVHYQSTKNAELLIGGKVVATFGDRLVKAIDDTTISFKFHYLLESDSLNGVRQQAWSNLAPEENQVIVLHRMTLQGWDTAQNKLRNFTGNGNGILLWIEKVSTP